MKIISRLPNGKSILIWAYNRTFDQLRAEFVEPEVYVDSGVFVQPESLHELILLSSGNNVHDNIIKALSGNQPLFYAYGYDRAPRTHAKWKQVRKIIPRGLMPQAFDAGYCTEITNEYHEPLYFVRGLEQYPQYLTDYIKENYEQLTRTN